VRGLSRTRTSGRPHDARLLLSSVTGSVCVLVVASTGVSAASSSRAPPDCLGHPQVEPRTVVFACGDGNFGFDHLTWVAWGGSRAVALGSGYLNDCRPYCAAGHFTRYRAVLTATGSQRCPNGQRAYLTVTYASVGRSPFPPRASGTFHPRQNFRCGKGAAGLR
jgi:hypothetical protein